MSCIALKLPPLPNTVYGLDSKAFPKGHNLLVADRTEITDRKLPVLRSKCLETSYPL